MDINDENDDKPYIVCTGRVHPGESNGSWMMEGYIRFLCSNAPEAIFLRRKYIFKIIPMMNPDGVILGNHRTGFCGNDLNRQFLKPDEIIHPTVIAIKELIRSLTINKKQPIFYFMDFHGHSQRKNVFIYGAEFPVYDNNYVKIKVFPKILSMQTDMFRFHSCRFRIIKSKSSTARAVISREFNVINCYTLEASYASFLNKDRSTIPFSRERFQHMGEIVAKSTFQFHNVIDEEERAKQKKLAGKMFRANNILLRSTNDTESIETPTRAYSLSRGDGYFSAPRQGSAGKDRFNKTSAQFSDPKKSGYRTIDIDFKRSKKPIKSRLKGIIPKSQSSMQESLSPTRNTELQKILNEIKQEDENHELNESDKESEGGSDSEGADDDLREEDLKELQDEITKKIELFHQLLNINFRGTSDKKPKQTKKKKEEKDDRPRIGPYDRPKTIQASRLIPENDRLMSTTLYNPQRTRFLTIKKPLLTPGDILRPHKVFLNEEARIRKNEFVNKIPEQEAMLIPKKEINFDFLDQAINDANNPRRHSSLTRNNSISSRQYNGKNEQFNSIETNTYRYSSQGPSPRGKTAAGYRTNTRERESDGQYRPHIRRGRSNKNYENINFIHVHSSVDEEYMPMGSGPKKIKDFNQEPRTAPLRSVQGIQIANLLHEKKAKQTLESTIFTDTRKTQMAQHKIKKISDHTMPDYETIDSRKMTIPEDTNIGRAASKDQRRSKVETEPNKEMNKTMTTLEKNPKIYQSKKKVAKSNEKKIFFMQGYYS